MFVAVGGSGSIITSTNTQTWTVREAPVTNALVDIAFGSGVFVAGGNAVNLDAPLLTSSDNGITWRKTLGSQYGTVCVAFINSRFVAMQGAHPYLSSDGQTWSEGNVFRAGPTQGVTLAYGRRVITEGGGFILTLSLNPDAVLESYPDRFEDWSLGNYREVLSALDVCYGDGRVVAVGPNGTIHSSKVPAEQVLIESSPSAGGRVTGGGVYQLGETATLSATALNGYQFRNWTQNGTIVSAAANYAFTVTGSHALTANFWIPVYYQINASVEPINAGGVSGSGSYLVGTTATVRATPNVGFVFSHWTEGSNTVSISSDFGFTVSADRALVAHFVPAATLSLFSNPSNGGTVSGAGSYPIGSTQLIRAQANVDWKFVEWNDGNTSSERSVIVPDGGITYTANFALRTLVARDDKTYTIAKNAVIIPVLSNDSASYALTITNVE